MNDVDINDPDLQFWQTDTLDKVYNTKKGQMYSVFHSEDGKSEFVGGRDKTRTRPDLYWSELTREEFKYLHPTVFQG